MKNTMQSHTTILCVQCGDQQSHPEKDSSYARALKALMPEELFKHKGPVHTCQQIESRVLYRDMMSCCGPHSTHALVT